MNETAAQIADLKEKHSDNESRLRAVEAAVIKLTEIAGQLKESAVDREQRIRKLEAEANIKPEFHDEDHEERLRRLEESLIKANEKNAAPQPAIIANLSARELVFIGLAFTGFVTGKWDWLTGFFK